MEKKYYVFLSKYDKKFLVTTKNISDSNFKCLCHGKVYEMKAYAKSLITRNGKNENDRLYCRTIGNGILTVINKFENGDTGLQDVEDVDVIIEKENIDEQ